ncbi:MAG: TIGR02300 family protein [Thermoanaerobaculia bacterium]
MPNLGTKYICYSCQTKFYDLGRTSAVCPKCGADQKDADSAAPVTGNRSRKVVEEFDDEVEELEEPAAVPEIEDEEEDIGVVAPGAVVAEDDDDDDEDEEF